MKKVIYGKPKWECYSSLMTGRHYTVVVTRQRYCLNFEVDSPRNGLFRLYGEATPIYYQVPKEVVENHYDLTYLVESIIQEIKFQL